MSEEKEENGSGFYLNATWLQRTFPMYTQIIKRTSTYGCIFLMTISPF